MPDLVIAVGSDALGASMQCWLAGGVLVPNRLQCIRLNCKLGYINNNPVVAGIVKKPEDYLFSSARD